MKKQLYTWLVLFFTFSWFSTFSQDTTLTNLPCFYITTQDSLPVTDKDNYIPGKLTVAGGTYENGYYSGDIEIRGRGNSTWYFPKKPYRIKLASKYNLLGMPAKAKSWVLLANYADKSLMRNAVAFEASKFFGFSYTPAYRMADVVLNGEYIGTYTIADQVEEGSNRVDIEELESEDVTLPAISGGYFLETGGATKEDELHSVTNQGLDMNIKYPDEDDINTQQIDYIRNYVQQFETSLFSQNFTDTAAGYRQFVDMKSLVDYYLISELCANSDCFWSTYMYKHRNDPKLYTGPVWDYDIAFNNDNRLGDESYKYMADFAHPPKPWIPQLLQDSGFYQSVRARWFELKEAGIVKRLQYVTDSLKQVLQQSQKLNFEKWPILNEVVYLETGARGSYNAEVKYLKHFINVHSAWLNKEFMGLEKDQSFRIVSGETGKVWDIYAASKKDSAGVVQNPNNKQKLSQVWNVINLNNGYYSIVNAKSGLVITNGSSFNRETQLLQTRYVAGDSTQEWRIVNTGDHYGIINRSSLQAADNFGSITTNNNPVTQFPQDIYNRINQFYKFTKTALPTAAATENKIVSTTFSIYPNPAATGNITVGLKLALEANTRIFIYNANGLLLRQINKGRLPKGNNSFVLSIAGLQTGNYQITIVAGTETASQQLLIK